jgi:ribonuclease VapC
VVLDSSALACLLFDEPEAARMEIAIEADAVRLISAGTLLEISIVVEARLGEPGVRELDLLLLKASVDTLEVTAEHVELARLAYRRFGRGRHPANLNFGDCFAYAAWAASGEPLLYKGKDFGQTDVVAVPY